MAIVLSSEHSLAGSEALQIPPRAAWMLEDSSCDRSQPSEPEHRGSGHGDGP